MNTTVFPSAVQKMMNGTLNLTNGSLKAAILDGNYTIDINATVFGDVDGFETTGAGYTAGGYNMGTPSLGYTLGNDTIPVFHNDAQWSNLTCNANGGAIIYKVGAANTSSPLLAWLNLFSMNGSSPVILTNANVAISFSMNGSLVARVNS